MDFRMVVRDDQHRSTPFSEGDSLSRLELLSNPRNTRNSNGSNRRTASVKTTQHQELALTPSAGINRPKGTISKLDSSGARKIHSAQVVLDPAGVIKELVENALDAGATRIDIRLRGKAALDSIAVSDNGEGISERDYVSVCRAASTSKIRRFHDLDSLTSFGFRGEALSSICSIAKSVSVLTRTAHDVKASTLKYNSDGALVERKPAARPVGTTVFVDVLFHNLPVRRKDALKNSARELAKCVAITQAISLISVNTRIELKVANDTKVVSRLGVTDRRSEAASGSSKFVLDLRKLRAVACNILGRKTASALLEMSVDNVTKHNSGNDSAHFTEDKQVVLPEYGCQGLISNASLDADGSGGRTRSSHQYVYANGRIVDFPRLTRSVNELYRRVTGFTGASPVLILNLTLPIASHDFNVAPDKREIFVRDEPGLIHGLLACLESIWAPKKMNRIPVQSSAISLFTKGCKPRKGSGQGSGDLIPEIPEAALQSETPYTVEKTKKVPSPQSLTVTRNVPVDSQLESSPKVRREGDAYVFAGEQSKKIFINNSDVPIEHMNFTKCPSSSRRKTYAAIDDEKYMDIMGSDSKATKKIGDAESLLTLATTDGYNCLEKAQSFSVGSYDNPDKQQDPMVNLSLSGSPELAGPRPIINRQSVLKSLCPAKRNITQFVSKKARSVSSRLHTSASPGKSGIVRVCGANRTSPESPKIPEEILTRVDERSSGTIDCRSKEKPIVKMDWSKVRTSQCASNQIKSVQRLNARKALFGASHCFEKSSITEDGALDSSRETLRAAEMEMSRLFQQEWFCRLEILGQFNRGFIICSLGADLFIIDQHASDEKFNFEELQRTTVISKQQLVRPLALELSAEDEIVVLQHLEAFRAGGFGIEYRENNEPTQRAYLRSQPVSKHTMFVQDDLRDIIDMLKMSLQQSSSMRVSVLRPPRVRAMFASRACRKSIMVGTSLHRSQMERIVRNLGSIEHPWTCPHGRPTMRHLCCLLGVEQ